MTLKDFGYNKVATWNSNVAKSDLYLHSEFLAPIIRREVIGDKSTLYSTYFQVNKTEFWEEMKGLEDGLGVKSLHNVNELVIHQTAINALGDTYLDCELTTSEPPMKNPGFHNICPEVFEPKWLIGSHLFDEVPDMIKKLLRNVKKNDFLPMAPSSMVKMNETPLMDDEDDTLAILMLRSPRKVVEEDEFIVTVDKNHKRYWIQGPKGRIMSYRTESIEEARVKRAIETKMSEYLLKLDGTSFDRNSRHFDLHNNLKCYARLGTKDDKKELGYMRYDEDMQVITLHRANGDLIGSFKGIAQEKGLEPMAIEMELE